MCFYIDKTPEIRIAKRNITVYKVCLPTRLVGRFTAKYFPFTYQLGQTYRQRYFSDNKGNKFRTKLSEPVKSGLGIADGFHSYRTHTVAITHSGSSYLDYVIVKCQIPKGALYIKNKIECVSLGLKVIGAVYK
jgi:hypothetical protein